MRRIIGLLIAGSMLAAGLLAIVGIPSFAGGSGASVAAAATSAQQIGMKVLLITDTSSQPAFQDWENTLTREGVPYDCVITQPAATDPTGCTSTLPSPLSSTASDGTQVAKYEGVVLATSGTEGLTVPQLQALQTFEHQFSVRQVTAYVVPANDPNDPGQSKNYGLNGANPVGGGPLATTDQFSLTTDGLTDFPYLTKIGLDPTQSTYAYQATVASPQAPGASVDTLISGPGNSSLLGIYTSADGRQTMYQTFDENQYYLQSELLRHGELDWLARDTYFGDQRNYLETHIDDNFLSDDAWSIDANPATDTAAHSTDYSPSSALRETAQDVTTAANWSKLHNFRIDMLFNGGGSVAFQQGCTDAAAGDSGSGGTGPTKACSGTAPDSDPLLSAFQANKTKFGWISHTWDHPNLDEGCATTNYIQDELQQNTDWGAQSGSGGTGGLGLTSSAVATDTLGAENPQTVVTGEHSGLPNLVPGNPGQVDPPAWDASTTPPSATGGTLAGGNYLYAIADQFNTAAPAATPIAGPGQSAASIQEVTVPAGTSGSVTLNWEAVCHAADYIIYRVPYTGTYPSGSANGTWSVVTSIPANTATDFTDPTVATDPTTGGAKLLSYSDTGTFTGSAASGEPQSAGTAIEGPYEQNPNLDTAFAAVDGALGIKYFGSDASKPYPAPPDGATGVFATGVPGSSYSGAQYPAGATFQDAEATAIPRYPTNIYYNVDTNAQAVDEYQTLYDLPSTTGTGQCKDVPKVTTCNPAGTPFTMDQIVQSIDQGMFAHMMGNDPRPDYFHQTNMMNVNPGSVPDASEPDANALFYQTVDPLLTQYSAYFNVSNTPIEQFTMAQIGTLLNEQSAWAKANASQITGSISGNVVSVANTGAAVEVPLTGTNVGSAYAGTTSGWTLAPAGTSTYTASTKWPDEPTGAVIFNYSGAPDPTPPTNLSGPPKNVTPPTAGQPKPSAKAKAKAAAVYVAVQVKPKTVSISKKGKVTVSLACKATKGKTAKNKLCAGSFTLKIAGQKLGQRFRFRSSKTHRFTVKLSTKVMSAAARASRNNHHRMAGSLLISTTQTHAKSRLTHGTLTIRI